MLRAPRMVTAARRVDEIVDAAKVETELVSQLASAMRGADVVVNAAGIARPAGRHEDEMYGANALLPRILLNAGRRSSTWRMVHVSSAAVQGNVAALDESDRYCATSLYAKAKAVGEQALLTDWESGTTIIRPTSVHGDGRALTRHLVRFARSPLSSVAAPGQAPTPQVLVSNVGAAIAYLCGVDLPIPPIVLQPSEGWTTSEFLQFLSGRQPIELPPLVVSFALTATGRLARNSMAVAHHRRLEMVWEGQAQTSGWLSTIGFAVPGDRGDWRMMLNGLQIPGSRPEPISHATPKPAP